MIFLKNSITGAQEDGWEMALLTLVARAHGAIAKPSLKIMSPSARCFLFLLVTAASEAFVHQLHHQCEVSVAHRRAFARPRASLRLHQSTTPSRSSVEITSYW